MKRFITSFGWLMLLLPLISVAGAKTVLSSLHTTASASEDRQVSGFTGISTSGAYDVYIKMSDKESLRLEGDTDEISKIETIVENGTLKIHYKKDVKKGWPTHQKKLTVYISAKSLNSLTMSGSGNIKVEGIVKASKLQTRVSGSGDILINASTEEYVAAISGSGSISISGTAKNAEAIISGSGDFKGKALRTNNAIVKVSGSGNAQIYADGKLDAVVSGSGSINYAGNAAVFQTKSGSGSISKF